MLIITKRDILASLAGARVRQLESTDGQFPPLRAYPPLTPEQFEPDAQIVFA
jgi:hypothetical protein